MLTLPDNLVLDSDEPINIVLIGAGGNGGEVLEYLCRIHQALIHNGRETGLHVTVIDDSEVRESNIVRQRFWPTDIGQNKATTLVNRYNMMMGFNWSAIPERFPVCNEYIDYNGHDHDSYVSHRSNQHSEFLCPFGVSEPDIIISAVDLPSVRYAIAQIAADHLNYPAIWLDLGNTDRTGQAIIGHTHKQGRVTHCDNVIDHYPEIQDMEDDTSKSCSAAESIRRQDLLVNPAVVVNGMNILWELLRYGKTNKNGVILSLETGQAMPILFAA